MNETHYNLSVGDRVHAPGIRTLLTVLEGPNKKGEYLLSHGILTLWVHKTKLKPAPATKVKKTSRKRACNSGHIKVSNNAKTTTLDLHGLIASEAIARLESAIDNALLHNTSKIEVIHGIGTGILRSAVHKYLSNSRHITHFHIGEQNAGNTSVYL